MIFLNFIIWKKLTTSTSLQMKMKLKYQSFKYKYKSTLNPEEIVNELINV